MKQIRINANMNFIEDNNIDIYIKNTNQNHRCFLETVYAEKRPTNYYEFIEKKEGCATQNHFSINIRDAQLLMSQLWNMGVRPPESKSSIGQLNATEKHLQDMRIIVKKKLDLEEF